MLIERSGACAILERAGSKEEEDVVRLSYPQGLEAGKAVHIWMIHCQEWRQYQEKESEQSILDRDLESDCSPPHCDKRAAEHGRLAASGQFDPIHHNDRVFARCYEPLVASKHCIYLVLTL